MQFFAYKNRTYTSAPSFYIPINASRTRDSVVRERRGKDTRPQGIAATGIAKVNIGRVG
jgi:hypothetical protein